MVIEMFLNVIYNIFDILLVFEIPSLPTEVMSYLETGFDYLAAGGGILANYVPMSYFMMLLGIVIIIEGALLTYRFVMFVMSKIPNNIIK